MALGLRHFQEQISELCERFAVKRLEIFGSTARGEDVEGSDVDLLVEFQELGWKGSFKRYMGLKLALEDLLGRSVDLVEGKAISNPYFARVVEQDRRVVYAA